MSQLEIAVTTHHDPETASAASVVKWLAAFKDAEVQIVQNDAREARVKLSLYDPIVGFFDSGRNDYLYRLFVRFHGIPAIWAPIKTDWNSDGDNHVTLIARDVDRLENHNLVEGDDATDTAIPADYRGLRILRDAAVNTPNQIGRYVVPLGIIDGTAGTESTAEVTFAKDANVFDSMQQLTDMTGAQDFELEPFDVADPDADGVYMKLNTYDDQGTNRTTGPEAVLFHDGYGLRNAQNMRAVPDRFVTHAHARGDGGDPVSTAYHADSSRYRGVYVDDHTTQFTDFDALALPFVAKSVIQTYGLPTHTWSIDLLPDALQKWVALAGYGIGDTVRCGVKRGYFNREEDFRITAMTLKQQDRTRQTAASLTIVPNLVDPLDISTVED